jgi:hemoglobin
MDIARIDEPRHPLTPYELIGGEDVVRTLVDRFYDLMDDDPDYFGIRKPHPASLEGSREKLFMFLTGWLAGPPLYEQAYGHPRLRARHMHVAIGIAERDQWMACMTRAMADAGVDPGLHARLVASFMKTADFMRNREG